MRDQGNTLTKQMWLLYNTFEDFIKVKHPEHGRKHKKKAAKGDSDDGHEWLKNSGISVSHVEDDSSDSIEQPRSAALERDFELTITKIPICEMDPIMMSDMEEPVASYETSADSTTPKRSPEKRTKGRQSIGDSNHHSSKKAKRSSAKKDIVVDKVVAPDATADLDKSVELFPWPLSVEHKKVLEASGMSVVRDSLQTSPPSSEENSPRDSHHSATGSSPAETTSSSLTRLRVNSPIISSGYESEVKEEEIDEMFNCSPGKEQKPALPMRPKKASPNETAADNKQQPIYENVDFVQTCTHASAEGRRSCSGAAELSSAGDATRQSTISESSIINIENKGLNLIKVGATLGAMFPDPRSTNTSIISTDKHGSSPRLLQRSMSAENLCFEREVQEFVKSPIYENIPRSLRGQVSPPRRFTMSVGLGSSTMTLPKPQPKHSSTPFRINLDTLSIQDIYLGASTTLDSTIGEDSRVELDLGVTPRMSAFRPYVPDKEKPVFTECLRTQNISPSYICMSRRQRRQATKAVSKKLFSTPRLARALDLTESGYASSKMVARRFQAIDPELTYDRAPPSVDSGRGGSVSPADDSNGIVKMASLLSEQTIDLTTVTEPEGEPIYESIADCTVYSRAADFRPDMSISLAEHTYDRIDNITASTLMDSPNPPELPPARTSMEKLPTASDASLDKTVTNSTVSSTRVPSEMRRSASRLSRKPVHLDQGVRKTDVIDQNNYHKYTVNDVLESVERLAGHLPSAKNRGNIYSLISDRRTRRQISKCLAKEKPPQRGPLKADHSQVVVKDHTGSPRPFDRWSRECNKENEIQGMAINRLPRYASIRKTTSFIDLSPNTRVAAYRDTHSLSRVEKSFTGEVGPVKCSAMPSKPSPAHIRTKVLTQTNHHYQNLQQFTGGIVKQSRPTSEILEPSQQESLRRTRSSLHLQWKNGALNEIWC